MITMDGKYRYRNGKTPRILCTDTVGDGSVLSMCEETKATYAHLRCGAHVYGVDEWDILPILSPPEYVPYDDSDRDEVRGKWIKKRGSDYEYMINYFSVGSVNNLSWITAFEAWIYTDGSVFGKIKK